MIVSPEHLAPFIVDSLLIVITCVVLLKRFSYAGLVLLASFILLHISIYFVLTHLSIWKIFIVDYHLYLAMYGLAVFGLLLLVSKNHYLLKLFIVLEVALHLVLVFFESVDWVYDNYSSTRMLIASFQIIGLVNNADRDDRRIRSLYTRWRSIHRSVVDYCIQCFTRILRVKRP